MPELPPVPDGLADRLRGAGVEAVPTAAYAWLRGDGSVKYTYGDYEGQEPPRGAPDEWVPEGCVPLYVLRPAVAAALASPPAAPTREPETWFENGFVWARCRECGRPLYRHWSWSHEGGTPPTDHDACPPDHLAYAAAPAPAPSGETADLERAAELPSGPAPELGSGETAGPIHDLIERSSLGEPDAVAARAQVSDEQAAEVVRRANALRSGETAERAKALLRLVWTQGHSAAAAGGRWRESLPEHVRDADVEHYVSQFAALLSSPAQTPGVHAALARLVALKDGPRDAAYEAAKDAAWQAARDALSGSPAQTPEPPAEVRGRLHNAFGAETVEGALTTMIDRQDRYGPGGGLVNVAYLRILRDAALSLAASPAQTDGEREWRVVLTTPSGAEACLWGAEPEVTARKRAAKYKSGRLESRRAPGPWSPVPSPETETPE